MLDDHKKDELIKKIKEQPKENDYYVIYTLKRGDKNLVEIRDKKIFVATKHSHNFQKFEEVPWEMIETVYNTLLFEKKNPLSQEQIRVGLNAKRSSFVMKVLSLLPEIEYDKTTKLLKWKE